MKFRGSKVHRANMGPIWGWQDPGGPHDGPMNFAILAGTWKNSLGRDVGTWITFRIINMYELMPTGKYCAILLYNDTQQTNHF